MNYQDAQAEIRSQKLGIRTGLPPFWLLTAGFWLLFCAMMAANASAQVAAHAPSIPAGASADKDTLHAVGRPVARVNGSVLTDMDLLHEMYAIFPYARQHNGAFPKAMEADIRRGALKMIEFEELVYQEALHRKMTIDPTRLDKAEVSFRQHLSSPQMYQVFLKTECHGSREVLRAKIRRSLLIEDLLKTEVAEKAAVSVAQARAWFNQHPENFRTPEMYAVQSISSVPPQNATPEQMREARKRAEGFLRQAKATKTYEEFGLLAEKNSEDDFRVMMGDHRMKSRAELPPQLLAALQNMQPGQVSEIIQVEQLYTVVRLNKHVPAGMQTFAEVKDSLRQNLQNQNVERLRVRLNSRLRKDAKIEEL